MENVKCLDKPCTTALISGCLVLPGPHCGHCTLTSPCLPPASSLLPSLGPHPWGWTCACIHAEGAAWGAFPMSCNSFTWRGDVAVQPAEPVGAGSQGGEGPRWPQVGLAVCDASCGGWEQVLSHFQTSQSLQLCSEREHSGHIPYSKV